jgi:precorrin-8X/cobalt-precorrin-8 methylmutase
MARLFDHYVIVDWSASSRPKTGRDSIWICHRGQDGERLENPPTRHLARLLLGDILAAAAGRGERVVLGFDFPFGYPAGFARRLGLNGAPAWRAIWDEIAALLHDGEDNGNDRFALGAHLNRRISGGRFPFWGCPAGFTDDHLGPRHHNGHAEDGLPERRLIDLWMRGAQPCWKLAYTGSVGSQALTGIPVVRALRDDERWAGRARIWPFETGLSLPDDATIVFAECWPSWWQWRPTQGPAEVNDRAQVRHVAALVAAADSDGSLASWFAGDPGLDAAQRGLVIEEEAWTLGVTGPKPRAISVVDSKRLFLRKSTPSPSMREGRDGGDLDAIRSEPMAPRHHHPLPTLPDRGGGLKSGYLRDPQAIYRRSFRLIREAANLGRFPRSLQPLAVRLAHAAGDTAILDDLVWSRGAAAAGRRALATGAAILVDGEMTAAGIARSRLPTGSQVICTLHRPEVAALAATRRTTRSAAAVELWAPYLNGAVVAIGNAPTALFRLIELLAEGADRPALVLGFPVGFVGAAEAKEALLQFGRGLAFVTLKGRRGGSALAAAAVNALGRPPPLHA